MIPLVQKQADGIPHHAVKKGVDPQERLDDPQDQEDLGHLLEDAVSLQGLMVDLILEMKILAMMMTTKVDDEFEDIVINLSLGVEGNVVDQGLVDHIQMMTPVMTRVSIC